MSLPAAIVEYHRITPVGPERNSEDVLIHRVDGQWYWGDSEVADVDMRDVVRLRMMGYWELHRQYATRKQP